MKKTIRLSDNGKETIQSRDEVALFFDIDFTELDTLIIDFEEIRFISRSPAHEFLKQSDKVQNIYSVHCEFISMNQDVSNMFEIIRNTVPSNAEPIEENQFDSKEEFYKTISNW